jgi:hypothetical protein
VFGSAIGAVGFYLLAGKLTDLSLGQQAIYVALAGAGVGLMLTPASTDAVNRAARASYSEVTGITQTARNLGASLGLAVLGTILVSRNTTNIASALVKGGVPTATAHRLAASFAFGQTQSSAHQPASLVHGIQLAFAHSTQTVFYVMAAVMAATFLVSIRWYPRGRAQEAHRDDGMRAAEMERLEPDVANEGA